MVAVNSDMRITDKMKQNTAHDQRADHGQRVRIKAPVINDICH